MTSIKRIDNALTPATFSRRPAANHHLDRLIFAFLDSASRACRIGYHPRRPASFNTFRD
jgi:hypothetical protein